ncbi:ATP-binding/permease protein CydC [Xenorhabdus poinarii G6]|uniref:Glutathione/L-cysteine transport system ATP-binding/permease protein CydC n=2 Tax=Xenorhabdus poinarii TaxID=40577 RepID=A0A068R3V4_9GAMM|nr:ATP-binding/permease protein CydC [Xenorhabdus poinarii G6]
MIMRVLLPFLTLYRRHWLLISLGMILAMVTLLASIGLLTLSGWFLAGTALAGFAGLYTFNYMLPAAGVRGAAIFRTAGRYSERLVSHDATFRVLAHLRVFAFQKILPLSPGGIARFRQGELLNRLVADVETLDHLYLRVISPVLAALVVILILTFGLGILDITLAYTIGGIMLGLLLILPVGFYHAGKSCGREITHQRGLYRTLLISALQGQAELSVFGALKRFRQSLTDVENNWLTKQQKQAGLTGLAQAIMIFSTGITVTLVLWLSTAGIGENSQAGAFIALFTFCVLAAFEALGPVTVAFQHMGQVISSATRVSQLMYQKPEIVFPSYGVEAHNELSLEIKNVDFTYPGQPLPVLKNISLSLAPGEHIALLGKTGCGKSTLLQLLTRAWDINSGEIQLNQHLISYYDEATLRSMMSVVPQRIHVFSHTLRENLLLAKPNANDDELITLLQLVGLEYLLDTDEKLNCWLGEGGRQLSGGEQRRLGIARALLHDAPLMLLDEPTEGLDADTEQQILLLLRRHCQHKALIIVTHRLTGLQHMDRICVMDGGCIIEQGKHSALLALQGRYYQFYQRQQFSLLPEYPEHR